MDFPDWSNFTPNAVADKLPLLLSRAEAAVALVEQNQSHSYENLIWGLDDGTRELWRCWGGVSHMMGVANSDAWRKLQQEWQARVVEFSLRVGQSRRIYNQAKAVLAITDDPIRKRILERMVRAAELSGVGLEGDALKRFNEIQLRLAKLSADFTNSVIDATTPEISDAAYQETMKHDPDRQKRERLYRLRVSRAPENAARIEEILELRKEEAAILGFENYAELSLTEKCAPSVSAVMKMIDSLDAATAAQAKAEELEGEPWDQAYNAERLRECQYSYSEEELKRHFELEKVLDGLFGIAKFLFGVEVVERVGEDRPSVWHDDVRFFSVVENGNTIANFYLDPYVRTGQKSGGAWMNEFRNRSVRNGKTLSIPLAVIVANFPLPDDNGHCFLPFREVETLFHEFGHALQCMLTRIDEEGAAGINLVEWDAVEVASQFMENWCLDGRTGIKVPPELKAKVIAARNFRAATACRRQLAFAKTDMLLHLGAKDAPDAVKSSVFTHFGLPMVAEDRFLCAFSHIFAGGYAAGYYGYKWAEVMSADCFGAFEEAGLEDDCAVKKVGNRYRNTILALGGSQSALDVFRAFRGREPEIASLLRQRGLS